MAGGSTDQSQAGVSSGASAPISEVVCPLAPENLLTLPSTVTCAHERLQDPCTIEMCWECHWCSLPPQLSFLGLPTYTSELPWPLGPCLSFFSLERTCSWGTLQALSEVTTLVPPVIQSVGSVVFHAVQGFTGLVQERKPASVTVTRSARGLPVCMAVLGGVAEAFPQSELTFSLFLCNNFIT